LWIRNRFRRIGPIPIIHPLGYIAAHVIKSKAVRFFAFDGKGLPLHASLTRGTVNVIMEILGHQILGACPGPQLLFHSTPGCVPPFSLGRQAVGVGLLLLIEFLIGDN
jgi:hypothetical protein